MRLERHGKVCEFRCVVDCVLGLDGYGSPYEWIPILEGKLRPRELTVISKTITNEPITAWPWEPFLRVKYLGNENWVNAYGLLNPGRKMAAEILPKFVDRVGQAIISVFAGNTTEAILLGQMVSSLSGVAAVELNCSCPNTATLSADEIIELADTLSRVCRLPIIAKLSADQDYVKIAQGLRPLVGAIHVTNTLRWNTIFPDKASPLAKRGGGGVSGPIVFPRTLECVQTLRAEGVELPIIGGGGINSTLNARLLIEAGANAIAVGTHVHHCADFPHLLERYLERDLTQRELSSP